MRHCATIAVILFAACTPDTTVDVDAGATAPDAGVPFTIASTCDAIHRTVCDGFSACGCTLQGRAFTADNCVDGRAGACVQALQPAAAALASGAADIDTANTTACLAGIRTSVDSCTLVDASTLPLACALLVRDRAPLGATCTVTSLPASCAAGAGVCSAGVCVELPRAGAPCAQGVLCAADLACTQGVCGAPVDPAPPADVGGSCAQTAQCAAGLICDVGVCATGPARAAACAGPTCSADDACVRDYAARTCTQPGAPGEACESFPDDTCDSGLTCSGGSCAPLPGDGDACDTNQACAAPTLCNTDTFICVVPPGDGEACLVGPALCGIGLGCNADNLCAPGPAVGGACLIPNNLCADGLACDFTGTGSVCVERKDVGGACQNNAVCRDGLTCAGSGSCEAALATGAPCPSGGGCDVDAACSDLAGGFTCQPVPSASGAPCADVCTSELACRGPGGICAPALCGSP